MRCGELFSLGSWYRAGEFRAETGTPFGAFAGSVGVEPEVDSDCVDTECAEPRSGGGAAPCKPQLLAALVVLIDTARCASFMSVVHTTSAAAVGLPSQPRLAALDLGAGA